MQDAGRDPNNPNLLYDVPAALEPSVFGPVQLKLYGGVGPAHAVPDAVRGGIMIGQPQQHGAL